MILRKVVTGANSDYFYSLITLLTTLFHRDDSSKYNLDIWDLGLTKNQLSLIDLCLRPGWVVRKLSELGEPPFPGAYEAHLRNFAWKPACIEMSIENCDSLLWIDSGVAIANPIQSIFNDVKEKKIVVYKNNDFINRDWTSKSCADQIAATSSELNAPQIHGNILAFHPSIESLNLLSKWHEACRDPKNVVSLEPSHRHDQSVLSLLVARFQIPIMSSTGIIQENSNFKLAVKKNKIFLAHRREFHWIDFNSLINPEHLLVKQAQSH